jgi:hypothetical protein
VIQASLLVWFPESFDEDPATGRAGKVEVLRRRAEPAAHRAAMADSIDTKSRLMPANSVLERVSRDGFTALVKRLRSGPAAD